MSEQENQDKKTGRFLPGNKLARGNPENRRARMLKLTAIHYLDRGKIGKLLSTLYKAATDEKKPDLDAAKYLIDRGLGKPTQATEISGPEGAPIKLDGPAFDEIVRRRMNVRSGTNN